MSHHLDTPLAAQTGQLYLDDLYVFPGEGSTVFIMGVNSNVNGLHSEPGFHPEARYEFKVHFDGADYETLTYRVSFGEAGSDGQQAVALHTLAGEAAREDAAAGDLVLDGRTGQTTAAADGTRLWAGRIADSFYIDLSLLALVNAAVAGGTAPDLSGWRPEAAQNSFAGSFVYSIVLEVPHAHPLLRPGARTGVWAATKLATDAGGWRQINRAGHPMMWPIFWPNDTDFTDPSNTRHPSQDVTAAKYIGDQIAAVVAASGTSDDPQGYGQAVAQDLFPDVLPYVVGTPAVYGFAGFNGRTMADNAPEAMLSLVAGTAVRSGLKPSVAKDQRRSTFPYVTPARRLAGCAGVSGSGDQAGRCPLECLAGSRAAGLAGHVELIELEQSDTFGPGFDHQISVVPGRLGGVLVAEQEQPGERLTQAWRPGRPVVFGVLFPADRWSS